MRIVKTAFSLFFLLSSVAFGGEISILNTARTSPHGDDDQIKLVVSKEVSFTGYLTGYSFWDNTPPGSAAIARPVIHRKAAGAGTYNDPITIAVGYRLVGGSAKLDYPAGTRFYIPSIRRYVIVEDICGNGPQPHLTGCHRGKSGKPWLDVYVDGSRAGAAAANACMRSITGMQEFIMHPRSNYPVLAGALTESGCGAATS